MSVIAIPSFEKANILVVGDVMLDRYWYGDVARISPEAPVPVARIKRIENRIGGAGNVALNISSLGGCVDILGLVGKDESSKVISELLDKAHVNNYLLQLPEIATISKTRVIGTAQQLIRLDFEENFTTNCDDRFFAAYNNCLKNCNLVIFSDYNKGTLYHVTKLIDLAKKAHKTVLVDPKSKDFTIYRNATVITPNFFEFENAVGVCRDNTELEDKAFALIEQCGFEAILITRGAGGMSLIEQDKAMHLSTSAQEVYDVTGAGDTVIATLGAALAVGEDLTNATVLANLAAGVVVKKFGAATTSSFELQQAIHKQQNILSSVLDEKRLSQQIAHARSCGEKIVMTNGCFDILHRGHIEYLEKAKSLGNRLLIAVNSDSSIKRLKGESRPINRLADRMRVLSALSFVDWIVAFDQDTPEDLIKLVSPDILVKGGDYSVHEIAGSDHVLGYGGEVIILPFEDGFSTSLLLKKLSNII